MSTNCQISKAQSFKNNAVWRIFGILLSKLAGPLIKVAVIFTKNILAPLGITAAAAAIDAGIKKTWSRDNNFNNFK